MQAFPPACSIKRPLRDFELSQEIQKLRGFEQGLQLEEKQLFSEIILRVFEAIQEGPGGSQGAAGEPYKSLKGLIRPLRPL